MIALTHAWNLSREPFGSDIPVNKLFPLPRLEPFEVDLPVPTSPVMTVLAPREMA